MKVSVIIPVKDRFDLFRMSFLSVLDQTRPPDEVVIVDDNSADDLEAFCKRIQPATTGTAVHVIRNAESLGPGGARNVGLDNASGDLVFFNDSDDCFVANKIETVLNILEHTQFDIICHPFIYSGKTLLSYKLYPRNALFLLKMRHVYWGSIFSPPCTAVHGKGLLMRFDESKPYCEDLDYGLRAIRKQLRIYFYNAPLTWLSRPPLSRGGLTEQASLMQSGAIETASRNGFSLLAAVFRIKWYARMLYSLIK